MVQSHVVAANIRAELARQRKKQGDIAEVLGITRQGVSRRLLGITPVDVDELAIIAELLNVPMAQLLGEEKASA